MAVNDEAVEMQLMESQNLKQDEEYIKDARKCNLNIIGPSIGWIGVIMAWSLQAGYGTPYLLSLGLEKSNVNYVWLAGPITGMIAQPLIGSFSDKIGTRKPFIIIGAITVFITLIIFSNARFITFNNTHYALIIAIIFFWINDFCISVLMSPLRALASDTISSSKQIDAMCWFALLGNVGGIVSFALGALISNVSILYFIGAISILLTCIISIKISYSLPISNAINTIPQNQKNLCLNGIVNIFTGIKRAPLFLWKLMLTQFWAFSAFLPLFVYGTHFYGENIMKGEVTDTNMNSNEYKLYQQGVKYGNLAFCLNGIVGILSACFISKYFINDDRKKNGIKIFWIISYVLYGIFVCLTPWIDNLILFIILHSLSGIAITSMNIFPWAITSKYAIDYEPQNAGIILAILNISVCVPQIIVALIGGIIIQQFHHNVASMLFFGGICGFIGAISVCFVDIEYKGDQYKNALHHLQEIAKMEEIDYH